MQRIVRNFKHYIVEARFTSAIAVMVALGMRAGYFYVLGMPARTYRDNGFVWKYMSGLFENPLAGFIFSSLCALAAAWILSLLNNRFSLIRNRTSLPFSVPLILFSAHPYFLQPTADYLSVIFVLCAFFPLLSSYQQHEAQVFSFKSSILIGIAGLFQVYALFLLPLFWKGQVSMRGLHFKSVLSSLLGVLLVYWCAFSVFFFGDDLPGFVQPLLSFARISFVDVFVLTTVEWIFAVGTLIFFLVYMLSALRIYSRDKVLTQITLRFLVFILSALLILQLTYWGQTMFPVLLGLGLISLPIAYLYSTATSKWVVRSFYLIIFIILILYSTNYLSVLPVSP